MSLTKCNLKKKNYDSANIPYMECYVCLEQIEYYYCFDCTCYNHVHEQCISNSNFNRCVICKKSISHKQFIKNDIIFNEEYFEENPNILNEYYKELLFDITLINYILNFLNINLESNKLILYLQEHSNFFSLILWFGISCSLTFLLIMPLFLISLLFNLCKIIASWFYAKYKILFITYQCDR
jgi:hypothetical protein